MSVSGRKVYRILLAEDNIVNAKLIEMSLKNQGDDVRIAADGIEVLEILKNSEFDIIIMDIEMPRMNGLETARLIRNGETGKRNRNIPIIAITAHVLEEILNQCHEAGINDLITKPVDIKELTAIIRGLL
jgi:CheY-like chemotaxis protein